jgi:transmembrane sensor
VRLAAGAARFSVTPNPQRKLRVLSGSTVVTVLGTVFDVSRSKSGVSVAVERGRVHVAWPDGARVLGAGETLAVPDPEASPQTELQVAPKPDDGATAAAVAPELAGAGGSEPPAGPGGMPRAAAPPSPQATASWRTLAQDGNYAGALARITQSGPESVKNEPGDLLLAADVARLGGQPERAVAWLERVVRAHASDSRAALAAFTLGRTLMDQLGRPREAAIAFAEARKLGKGGALAEDALAREVEGWSRAGEATLARQRALEYVERYPKGRRRAAVKRLGELE